MKNGLEFADFLALMSLYLGIKNLTENEQQSDQQIKILQQIDVGAANDRQAAYLLEEISRQFAHQNLMLDEIIKLLKVIKNENN